MLETALEFEIRGCIDYTEKTKGAAVDRTNAWVHEAASRTGASQPFPIVADGLLELVFNTSGFHTLKWDRHAAALTSSQIPHTLLLDLHRIRLFHSDTTDLIVVYMLLMLFRSLAGPNATEAQVDSMTHDIWILLQSNKLVRSAPSSESSSFPSSSSLSRTAKLESASWRKGVQDVLLQIAARAEAVKAGKTDFADISIPDTATINLLQGWMNNNLRPKADLFRLFQSRLREGLQRLVMAEYGSDGSSASSSWWMRSTQHTEATEPEFIPSVPLNWGQCSRASRMQDLTLVSHSSPRSHKRLRDDAEDAMPRKKRKVAATTSDRPASKSEAVELDAFFKRSGLYSLRQEVQALGDRMGKVAAFNVEVWNAL